MKKNCLRFIGIFTLFCFITTQCVWANPGARIEIAATQEIPNFLSLDIPSDLATIDEIYEAPVRQNPRFILHIQNAHANYPAQIKIKQLLDFLNKKYAIKTVFVEGADSELNSDFLKPFPDPASNSRFADRLAQQGEVTGAELFLLEAPKDVKGIGIENADLYRKNYEALKEVFGAEQAVEHFFKGFDKKLDQVASKTFTPQTRELISDWKNFEKGHREFLPYVKGLVRKAKTVLDVDLESLFAQVGWPQMTRLLVVQTMEKDVNRTKALAERDSLVKFLKDKKASAALVRAIQNFQEGNISMGRAAAGPDAKEILPRWILEQLASEAGPKGFKFSDFPSFSLYAGYVVLKNELDPKQLFDEISYLFENMLDKLGAEPAQKKLLELYRDGELLRKLLHLELNRAESRKAQARQQVLNIESMVARLKEVVAASRNEDVKEDQKVMPREFAEQMDHLFESGLSFYDLARKREDAFFTQIGNTLASKKLGKAVLVTGGYHTDGLSEVFRENEISYGIVTPRLSEKSNEKMYRDSMMQRTKTRFDIATLEHEILTNTHSLTGGNAPAIEIYVSALLDEMGGIRTEPALHQTCTWTFDPAHGAAQFVASRGGTLSYVATPKKTLTVNTGTDGETYTINIGIGANATIHTTPATQPAKAGESASITFGTPGHQFTATMGSISALNQPKPVAELSGKRSEARAKTMGLLAGLMLMVSTLTAWGQEVGTNLVTRLDVVHKGATNIVLALFAGNQNPTNTIHVTNINIQVSPTLKPGSWTHVFSQPASLLLDPNSTNFAGVYNLPVTGPMGFYRFGAGAIWSTNRSEARTTGVTYDDITKLVEAFPKDKRPGISFGQNSGNTAGHVNLIFQEAEGRAQQGVYFNRALDMQFTPDGSQIIVMHEEPTRDLTTWSQSVPAAYLQSLVSGIPPPAREEPSPWQGQFPRYTIFDRTGAQTELTQAELDTKYPAIARQFSTRSETRGATPNIFQTEDGEKIVEILTRVKNQNKGNLPGLIGNFLGSFLTNPDAIRSLRLLVRNDGFPQAERDRILKIIGPRSEMRGIVKGAAWVTGGWAVLTGLIKAGVGDISWGESAQFAGLATGLALLGIGGFSWTFFKSNMRSFYSDRRMGRSEERLDDVLQTLDTSITSLVRAFEANQTISRFEKEFTFDATTGVLTLRLKSRDNTYLPLSFQVFGTAKDTKQITVKVMVEGNAEPVVQNSYTLAGVEDPDIVFLPIPRFVDFLIRDKKVMPILNPRILGERNAQFIARYLKLSWSEDADAGYRERIFLEIPRAEGSQVVLTMRPTGTEHQFDLSLEGDPFNEELDKLADFTKIPLSDLQGIIRDAEKIQRFLDWAKSSKENKWGRVAAGYAVALKIDPVLARRVYKEQILNPVIENKLNESNLANNRPALMVIFDQLSRRSELRDFLDGLQQVAPGMVTLIKSPMLWGLLGGGIGALIGNLVTNAFQTVEKKLIVFAGFTGAGLVIAYIIRAILFSTPALPASQPDALEKQGSPFGEFEERPVKRHHPDRSEMRSVENLSALLDQLDGALVPGGPRTVGDLNPFQRGLLEIDAHALNFDARPQVVLNDLRFKVLDALATILGDRFNQEVLSVQRENGRDKIYREMLGLMPQDGTASFDPKQQAALTRLLTTNQLGFRGQQPWTQLPKIFQSRAAFLSFMVAFTAAKQVTSPTLLPRAVEPPTRGPIRWTGNAGWGLRSEMRVGDVIGVGNRNAQYVASYLSQVWSERPDKSRFFSTETGAKGSQVVLTFQPTGTQFKFDLSPEKEKFDKELDDLAAFTKIPLSELQSIIRDAGTIRSFLVRVQANNQRNVARTTVLELIKNPATAQITDSDTADVSAIKTMLRNLGLSKNPPALQVILEQLSGPVIDEEQITETTVFQVGDEIYDYTPRGYRKGPNHHHIVVTDPDYASRPAKDIPVMWVDRNGKFVANAFIPVASLVNERATLYRSEARGDDGAQAAQAEIGARFGKIAFKVLQQAWKITVSGYHQIKDHPIRNTLLGMLAVGYLFHTISAQMSHMRALEAELAAMRASGPKVETFTNIVERVVRTPISDPGISVADPRFGEGVTDPDFNTITERLRKEGLYVFVHDPLHPYPSKRDDVHRVPVIPVRPDTVLEPGDFLLNLGLGWPKKPFGTTPEGVYEVIGYEHPEGDSPLLVHAVGLSGSLDTDINSIGRSLLEGGTFYRLKLPWSRLPMSEWRLMMAPPGQGAELPVRSEIRSLFEQRPGGKILLDSHKLKETDLHGIYLGTVFTQALREAADTIDEISKQPDVRLFTQDRQEAARWAQEADFPQRFTLLAERAAQAIAEKFRDIYERTLMGKGIDADIVSVQVLSTTREIFPQFRSEARGISDATALDEAKLPERTANGISEIIQSIGFLPKNVTLTQEPVEDKQGNTGPGVAIRFTDKFLPKINPTDPDQILRIGISHVISITANREGITVIHRNSVDNFSPVTTRIPYSSTIKELLALSQTLSRSETRVPMTLSQVKTAIGDRMRKEGQTDGELVDIYFMKRDGTVGKSTVIVTFVEEANGAIRVFTAERGTYPDIYHTSITPIVAIGPRPLSLKDVKEKIGDRMRKEGQTDGELVDIYFMKRDGTVGKSTVIVTFVEEADGAIRVFTAERGTYPDIYHTSITPIVAIGPRPLSLKDVKEKIGDRMRKEGQTGGEPVDIYFMNRDGTVGKSTVIVTSVEEADGAIRVFTVERGQYPDIYHKSMTPIVAIGPTRSETRAGFLWKLIPSALLGAGVMTFTGVDQLAHINPALGSTERFLLASAVGMIYGMVAGGMAYGIFSVFGDLFTKIIPPTRPQNRTLTRVDHFGDRVESFLEHPVLSTKAVLRNMTTTLSLLGTNFQYRVEAARVLRELELARNEGNISQAEYDNRRGALLAQFDATLSRSEMRKIQVTQEGSDIIVTVDDETMRAKDVGELANLLENELEIPVIVADSKTSKIQIGHHPNGIVSYTDPAALQVALQKHYEYREKGAVWVEEESLRLFSATSIPQAFNLVLDDRTRLELQLVNQELKTGLPQTLTYSVERLGSPIGTIRLTLDRNQKINFKEADPVENMWRTTIEMIKKWLPNYQEKFGSAEPAFQDIIYTRSEARMQILPRIGMAIMLAALLGAGCATPTPSDKEPRVVITRESFSVLADASYVTGNYISRVAFTYNVNLPENVPAALRKDLEARVSKELNRTVAQRPGRSSFNAAVKELDHEIEKILSALPAARSESRSEGYNLFYLVATQPARQNTLSGSGMPPGATSIPFPGGHARSAPFYIQSLGSGKILMVDQSLGAVIIRADQPESFLKDEEDKSNIRAATVDERGNIYLLRSSGILSAFDPDGQIIFKMAVPLEDLANHGLVVYHQSFYYLDTNQIVRADLDLKNQKIQFQRSSPIQQGYGRGARLSLSINLRTGDLYLLNAYQIQVFNSETLESKNTYEIEALKKLGGDVLSFEVNDEGYFVLLVRPKANERVSPLFIGDRSGAMIELAQSAKIFNITFDEHGNLLGTVLGGGVIFPAANYREAIASGKANRGLEVLPSPEPGIHRSAPDGTADGRSEARDNNLSLSDPGKNVDPAAFFLSSIPAQIRSKPTPEMTSLIAHLTQMLKRLEQIQKMLMEKDSQLRTPKGQLFRDLKEKPAELKTALEELVENPSAPAAQAILQSPIYQADTKDTPVRWGAILAVGSLVILAVASFLFFPISAAIFMSVGTAIGSVAILWSYLHILQQTKKFITSKFRDDIRGLQFLYFPSSDLSQPIIPGTAVSGTTAVQPAPKGNADGRSVPAGRSEAREKIGVTNYKGREGWLRPEEGLKLVKMLLSAPENVGMTALNVTTKYPNDDTPSVMGLIVSDGRLGTAVPKTQQNLEGFKVYTAAPNDFFFIRTDGVIFHYLYEPTVQSYLTGEGAILTGEPLTAEQVLNSRSEARTVAVSGFLPHLEKLSLQELENPTKQRELVAVFAASAVGQDFEAAWQDLASILGFFRLRIKMLITNRNEPSDNPSVFDGTALPGEVNVVRFFETQILSRPTGTGPRPIVLRVKQKDLESFLQNHIRDYISSLLSSEVRLTGVTVSGDLVTVEHMGHTATISKEKAGKFLDDLRTQADVGNASNNYLMPFSLAFENINEKTWANAVFGLVSQIQAIRSGNVSVQFGPDMAGGQTVSMKISESESAQRKAQEWIRQFSEMLARSAPEGTAAGTEDAARRSEARAWSNAEIEQVFQGKPDEVLAWLKQPANKKGVVAFDHGKKLSQSLASSQLDPNSRVHVVVVNWEDEQPTIFWATDSMLQAFARSLRDIDATTGEALIRKTVELFETSEDSAFRLSPVRDQMLRRDSGKQVKALQSLGQNFDPTKNNAALRRLYALAHAEGFLNSDGSLRSELRLEVSELLETESQVMARQELAKQVWDVLEPGSRERLRQSQFDFNLESLAGILAQIVISAEGELDIKQVAAQLMALVELKPGEMDWNKFLELAKAKGLTAQTVASVSDKAGAVVIGTQGMTFDEIMSLIESEQAQLGMNSAQFSWRVFSTEGLSEAQIKELEGRVTAAQLTFDYKNELIGNRFRVAFVPANAVAKTVKEWASEVTAKNANFSGGAHVAVLLENVNFDGEVTSGKMVFLGTPLVSQGDKALAAVRSLAAKKASQAGIRTMGWNAIEQTALLKELPDVFELRAGYFTLSDAGLMSLVKLWSDIMAIRVTSKSA